MAGETDLIVLPEMFSTGFSMKPGGLAEPDNGPSVEFMRSLAKEKDAVVTGSVMTGIEKEFFNRLTWMRPDGTRETYDKKHLFRYAGEHEVYKSGTKKLVVELGTWKISCMICYDLRFPVFVRNRFDDTGVADYDLLLFVANWPERRSHPWKTLLRARAMENLCYVAGLNRVGEDGNGVSHSGDSAVIDAKGDSLYEFLPGEEKVQTISLTKNELLKWRTQFPAWKDADEFQLKP